MTILDIEKIEWRSVKDALPDDEMTVLVSAPHMDEPIWLGWYEEGRWFNVEGGVYKKGVVVAWAKMPAGPSKE